MNPQMVDLTKRAALASVTYAAMAGVAFILLTLLSKIPVLGIAFFCLNFLTLVGAAIGIGFLVTPRLSNLPLGQSKPMLALFIGLGVAATITVARVVSNLIDSLFDIVTGNYGPVGMMFNLFTGIAGGVIGGLLIGTACAFLGSYLAFERNKSLEVTSRPF